MAHRTFHHGIPVGNVKEPPRSIGGLSWTGGKAVVLALNQPEPGQPLDCRLPEGA